MVNVGSEEPAQIVTKLRQALDAVSRLSSERAALEEALKVSTELPMCRERPNRHPCWMRSSIACSVLRLCVILCGPMWAYNPGLQAIKALLYLSWGAVM